MTNHVARACNLLYWGLCYFMKFAVRKSYMYAQETCFILHCAFPGNIRTRVWFQKPNFLKGSAELNCNFRRGGGGIISY